ncbi:MAG: prolyl oligopeptidase family serine peptidase [Candidatus Bathyarchaeia archaeon]|jgi:pimeloyl-ACP methyl ester carboxylesterase
MKNEGEAKRVSLDLKFKSIAVALVVVLYLATILVPVNAAAMSITLESPANNAVTMNNQPDFEFIAIDASSPTLSCTLWLNLTTSGTPTAYGTNGSVVNGASTIIMPSSPIPNGQYQWWINCSDGAASIISEKRTITVNVFRGDVSFTASYDGSTRYYWLDIPDHFDGVAPTPLVIFLQGYGQDRSTFRTYYPVLQQIFQQNGWMVACTDCRYVGNTGYQDWYSVPSRSDITDVINLLEQEFNIDRSHIDVMGTSMGGSGALKYAMFNPDIIASACDVVGVTNFTEFYYWTTNSDLHNSIAAAYGGTPSAVPQVYNNESPLGNEIRFMHTPVFLLHGSADTVVPVSNSRNLNNSLSQAGYVVKYDEVPGVDHSGTVLIGGREQEIYEWFRDHPLHSACAVVRGMDDRIYYRVGYDGTGWEDWNVLPGSTIDSPAAAVCADKLYVVVRGSDSTSLWFSSVDLTDSSFSGWMLLSGSTPSPPTLSSNGTALALTVRGEDNRIYYRFYTIGTQTWTGWSVLPSGATPDSPAASLVGNELNIVVRGTDGSTLWYSNIDQTTGAFSGWTLLSGSTPSPPTLSSNGTSLALVVRGGDNRIYYRFYTIATQTRTGWNALPSGTTQDSPAATILQNTLYIVVKGSDGSSLWQSSINLDTSTFTGWTLLDGATPSAPTLTS